MILGARRLWLASHKVECILNIAPGQAAAHFLSFTKTACTHLATFIHVIWKLWIINSVVIGPEEVVLGLHVLSPRILTGQRVYQGTLCTHPTSVVQKRDEAYKQASTCSHISVSACWETGVPIRFETESRTCWIHVALQREHAML